MRHHIFIDGFSYATKLSAKLAQCLVVCHDLVSCSFMAIDRSLTSCLVDSTCILHHAFCTCTMFLLCRRSCILHHAFCMCTTYFSLTPVSEFAAERTRRDALLDGLRGKLTLYPAQALRGFARLCKASQGLAKPCVDLFPQSTPRPSLLASLTPASLLPLVQHRFYHRRAHTPVKMASGF